MYHAGHAAVSLTRQHIPRLHIFLLYRHQNHHNPDPDTVVRMLPNAPLVLAIEISNPAAWTPASPTRPGVAVGIGSGSPAILIAAESIDPTRVHDDDLMPAIDRLFSSQKLPRADITRIAVSIGPGGFTATRIAVTTAKLIAEVTGAQCIAVPSASVAYAAANTRVPALIALASKGETAHTTRFDGDGRLVAAQVIHADDIDLNEIALIIADSFLPPRLRERAVSAKIPVQLPNFDPRVLLAIEHQFPPCSPIDLNPLYPREPEAVTKWRELKRLGKK
jgi:tRNA threonylcarbamoyl adenosine modification protein YeaZ